ncbi:MAG: class I SAM-dependent methyltransferase [Candidatus Micrarchaeia archaeon]
MGILKKITTKLFNKIQKELVEKIEKKLETNNEILLKILEKIEENNILLNKISNSLEKIRNNDPRHPQYLFYKVCEYAQKQTIEYIYTNMSKAICIVDHEQFLRYCLSQCKTTGDIFEFGVYTGYTINFFANLEPETDIYGFDSFEGLPEDWNGYHYFDFNLNGEMPKVKPNVKLIKGWFSKSLPEFLKEYRKNDIKLIHVDCDLYSSTKTIFENLENYIKKDLIIIFDEYFNYPNFQLHEFKAFKEFVTKNNIKYQYIAYCGERVAVRIL